MLRWQGRQPASSWFAMLGCKDQCSLASQVGGKLLHPGRGFVRRHEQQEWRALRDQRHGTMLELGAAKRLGVKIACFLELECSLAGDWERRPPPNRDETSGARDPIHFLTPRGRSRASQPLRQALNCDA